MINFYWAFFITGTVLTALSFLLDGLFESIDLDFKIGDTHLPIKSFNIILFLTVFGGSGVIITHMLPFPAISQYIAVVPSAVIGYVAGRKLYVLLNERLKKFETSAVSSKDLIGVEATVAETIPAGGGLGKIIFVVNGNTISAVARSGDIESNGFPRHSKVYISKVNDTVHEVVDSLNKIPKINTRPESANHVIDLRDSEESRKN